MDETKDKKDKEREKRVIIIVIVVIVSVIVRVVECVDESRNVEIEVHESVAERRGGWEDKRRSVKTSVRRSRVARWIDCASSD